VSGIAVIDREPIGAPVASSQMRHRPLWNLAFWQITPGALSPLCRWRVCACVGGRV